MLFVAISLDSVRKSVHYATRLIADLQHHLNDFSPVRRLPPELLSLVFTLATHNSRRHKTIFHFDKDPAAFYSRGDIDPPSHVYNCHPNLKKVAHRRIDHARALDLRQRITVV
ncbi:hypothetical protein OH76DRAFT_1486824 [Lentinus brumalis]|uniref:Uncharacterized protein n=1 Tax=Lentinus brumalis TaxID=2498619 RepID=A0A371CX16_9APHY|nr:hypothetical protein OH76DRAFT_1486824 [Polyporus brumalis]